MAALNFSVNLTDTSGAGIGPWTAVVLQNPTAATGGTDITANAGTQYVNSAQVNILANQVGTINPQELMGYAAHVLGDVIANTNQSDPLN